MLKWIVLIWGLTLSVFIIWILVCDLIVGFEMMKVSFIQLWRFSSFDLIIFSETEVISKKFIKNIIENLFSIVHLFTRFDCYSWKCKFKFKQNKSRISLMFKLRIIEIFWVSINKEMFVIKLILFNSTWRDHSWKYFFDMLDINKMRHNIRLLKEPNKPKSRHSLILQFYFPMRQQ